MMAAIMNLTIQVKPVYIPIIHFADGGDFQTAAQCFKRADLLTKLILNGEREVSLKPAWQGLLGFGQKPKPNQTKTKNISETMVLAIVWPIVTHWV